MDLKIPNHVAIIVDGNGRWAKEKGKNRSEGHDAGLKNLKKLTKYIFSKGIKFLSIYVFSVENFKRDNDEVNHLMNLFVFLFKKNRKYFAENNIKVVFSGSDVNLPREVISARDEIVRLTKDNDGGVLNICLNYSGRLEIVDATKKIISAGVDIDDIDEELFSKYLYQDLPDVDFMIRTSGEYRVSNFLLWQISYAEFYFPNKYFPDFGEDDFDLALVEYTKRDRRFGGINKK